MHVRPIQITQQFSDDLFNFKKLFFFSASVGAFLIIDLSLNLLILFSAVSGQLLFTSI